MTMWYPIAMSSTLNHIDEHRYVYSKQHRRDMLASHHHPCIVVNTAIVDKAQVAICSVTIPYW